MDCARVVPASCTTLPRHDACLGDLVSARSRSSDAIQVSLPKTSSVVTEFGSSAAAGVMFAFLSELILVVRSRQKSRARLEAETLSCLGR